MSANGGPDGVTNGLLLHLDAADIKSYPRTGILWYDRSGNRNNGTLTNGPAFNSGNGGSVVFDGTDDYVNIPYTSILTPTSQISFEATAYLTNWDVSTDYRILSKTQSGGYNIGLNEPSFITNGYLGGLVFAGGSYRIVRIPRSSVSSGWHHLAFTFDGRYFKMYLDGINVNSYDIGSTTTISYSSNNSLLIGAEVGSGSTPDGIYPNGSYLNGRVASVKIYNRALSQQEVIQNYNATKSRFNL